MRPSDEQLCRAGASLREIDPSTLQPDPEEGDVRWFLGEGGAELFAWVHPQAPAHHVQLVFARVSVEWSAGAGLRTGTFAGGSSIAGGRYDPYLLTLGRSVDLEVCRAALLLLGSSSVDPEIRQPLLTALGETLHEVEAREQAVAAPGPSTEGGEPSP